MNGKFRGDKVLFVGLNTIDLQFVVSEYPEVNTKSKASFSEIHTGGPAANAAVTCAHLGEKVDLLTPIGQNVFTEFIRKDILQYGVHLIDPVSHEITEPVFASIITSGDTGDRTVFSYHPKNQYKSSDKLNLKINDYKLIMFDGFHPEFAIPIAVEGSKNRIPTVLDGGSWKPGIEKLLNYIDIALCSDDFHVPGIDNRKELIEFLFDHGVKKCCITRGGKNIICSDKRKISEIEVTPEKVVDTLGAGDVFHGTFCFFYVNGYTFTEAMKKASAVAGESCKSIGARQWIRSYPIENLTI